jgi:hypothetical protein
MDLISGVAFGEMDFIRGVAFGEMDFIRGMAFGEMDFIRGGLLLYTRCCLKSLASTFH